MRTLKWIAWLVVCTCMLWLACRNDQITDFLDEGGNDVVINLQGINPMTIVGEDRDIVSVLDSLYFVTEQNGSREEHSLELTEQDSVIIFEKVEVEKGMTTFSAEIVSNNGTQIYFGSTNVDVREDEFEVEIVLDTVEAILAVTPDSLVMGADGIISVLNTGVKTLFWEITAASQQAGLEFDPSGGGISPGSSVPVTIYSEAQTGETFIVTIDSQVGQVEIPLSVVRKILGQVIVIATPEIREDMATIADSLYLTISPRSGPEQLHVVQWGSTRSNLAFNVEVEKGPVAFNAEIRSNRDIPIYRGRAFLENPGDGFQTQVEVSPVDAVLAVEPDSLITRTAKDQFWIFNKGTEPLTWWIEDIATEPACSSNPPCLNIRPDMVNLAAKDSMQVDISITKEGFEKRMAFVVQLLAGRTGNEDEELGYVELYVLADVIQ